MQLTGSDLFEAMIVPDMTYVRLGCCRSKYVLGRMQLGCQRRDGKMGRRLDAACETGSELHRYARGGACECATGQVNALQLCFMASQHRGCFVVNP